MNTKTLLSIVGLAMAGAVHAQTTQEYPAGYDVATGRLHIPCLEVSSVPGTYEVSLDLAATTPLAYRVSRALAIQTLVACKSASYDSKTGVLNIPKVELTQSLGSYAVTLQQTDPSQLIFAVSTLKAL